MKARNFFLYKTYRNISVHFPKYVSKKIGQLLWLSLSLSLLEVLGLLLVLPIIHIVLDSQAINDSKLLSLIYRTLEFSDNIDFVIFLFGVLSLFFTLKTALIYVVTKTQSRISYKIAERLTNESFEYLLTSSFSFHAQSNAAELLRKIVGIPFEFVGQLLLPFIIAVSEIIIMILILFGVSYISPAQIVPLLLLAVPFLYLYTLMQKKKLHNISESRNRGHSKMFTQAKQGIEGFKEILLFNKMNYFSNGYQQAASIYSKSCIQANVIHSITPKITELVTIFSISSVFLIGIFIGSDLNTLATFVATFSLASYRLIPSVNKIISNYNQIKSSDYIFDHYRGYKSDVQKSSAHKVVHAPMEFSEVIEVKELSFAFPNSSGKIIDDVSFKIIKGETIGIIGSSGVGKTTLINLLLFLLKADQGSIQIDGREMEVQDMGRWHKTISYVPQHITLIDGSIEENIAFGVDKSEINEQLLEEVIEKSQLKDYIDKLPDGKDTLIGDRGLNISGGQKQRIAIARALYHNGSLLIFDEATSSLDGETARDLTESIEQLSKQNYTILIITHRKETLKYCNKVYKLKNGLLHE